MKLLFAIKSLNAQGGGAERVLVEVCNGLAKRGHDVAVLTYDPPGGASFYPMDARVARLDLGIAPPGGRPRTVDLALSLPRIRRLVQNARPAAAVAFMHSICVPVAASLYGSGIPLVFSEHIDFAHYRTRPAQRLLRRVAERRAIVKTVPAPSLREEHPEPFRSRVVVVPNPVDLSGFACAAACEPGFPPVLLCVGRMVAQKNQIDLIRAFARLAPCFPDWKLRILGEGGDRPRLEAEAARLGLAGRVEMPRPTRDIGREYAAASIVAVPSLYESFGLVAAEAMACGRPVISFDRCLGVADMIEDGRTGLLARGSDSADERVANLSEGLKRLMSDPQLRRRLGEAASVRRYGLDGVLDAWEALLCSVASAPAAPAPERAGK